MAGQLGDGSISGRAIGLRRGGGVLTTHQRVQRKPQLRNDTVQGSDGRSGTAQLNLRHKTCRDSNPAGQLPKGNLPLHPGSPELTAQLGATLLCNRCSVLNAHPRPFRRSCPARGQAADMTVHQCPKASQRCTVRADTSLASLPHHCPDFTVSPLESMTYPEVKTSVKQLCAVLLDTVRCVTLHLKSDEAAKLVRGGLPTQPAHRSKLSELPNSKSRTGLHRSKSSTVYIYLLTRSK